MNKALLILLLVAIGVVACWLFSGEEPHLPPDVAGDPTEAVAGDVADAVGEPAAAVSIEVETATSVSSVDALRADADADPESAGRVLLVQVWLGKAGVPAPDAEVFMLEGSDEAKARSEDPFAPHLSTLGEMRGRRFQADAEGRVELPPVEDWVILTARTSGAFGGHFVGRGHAEVEAITLRPDETVTVRVVDGKGKPVAGAPVGVLQHVPILAGREKALARMGELKKDMTELWGRMQSSSAERERGQQILGEMKAEYGRLQLEVDGGKGGKRGRGKKPGGKSAAATKATRRKARSHDVRAELRASRRTDERGLAVFRHFQLYRDYGEEWWPDPSHDQFEAVLLTPLSRPESHVFAGRPVSGGTIELRMPDTGSIALRTVDRDGRPFTHPVFADLRIAGGDAPRWSRVQARKEQNERAIVFPFVGLDLSLGASCRLDDEDFRWRVPPFAGPKSLGERVEIDLVVAPEAGMLFGRLLDGVGRPLRGKEVAFLINALAGRLEGEKVLLDDDGRFHLPYHVRPEHQPPFRLQIRRRRVVPVAGRSLVLESLPPARVTDIGELRIDRLEIVAGGVVSNDVGEPIPGAFVQLQRERVVEAKTAAKEFREEAFCNVDTDAEGRFALFGELERGRYRLRVEAEDHFAVETPDLHRGDGDLRLQLQRKSRLRGTFIVPEWMHPGYVRIDLLPVRVPLSHSGEAEPRRGRIEGRDLDIDWLRPGTYEVRFAMKGFREPFLRIEDLVLTPGQDDVHPRLRELDLARYIHRFEIHAVDENGAPVVTDRPLVARVEGADGRPRWLGLPMRGKAGEIFSATPQLEVFPMASGFVAERQVLVPGRNEIVYRQVPPVDVILTGLSTMSRGVSVQVVLEQLELGVLPLELDGDFDNISRRMSGWYAKARFSAATLDDHDTARVRVPGEGSHRVVLRFGSGKSGARPTVELGVIEVRLVPGADPERIAVPFETQVVQQAIADARQLMAERAQQQGGR